MKQFKISLILALSLTCIIIPVVMANSDLIDQAQKYIEEKQYNNAISILEVLIRDNPEDIETITLLGEAYYFTNNNEQAVKILENGLNSDALYEIKNVKFFTILANVYHELELHSKAIAILLQGKDLFPDHTEIYTDLAYEYFQLNQVDLALKNLEKAISIDQTDYVANLNMAEYYRKIDKLDKSMQYLQVLKQSGNYTMEVKYREADIYEQQGDQEIAEDLYQKMIVENSNFSVAYYRIGYINYQKADYEKAVSYFSGALQKQVDFIPAYGMLARTYYKMGMLEKAEDTYVDALKIKPDDQLLLYNLGTLYYLQKDYTKALPILEKYLEINPTDSNVEQVLIKLRNMDL